MIFFKILTFLIYLLSFQASIFADSDVFFKSGSYQGVYTLGLNKSITHRIHTAVSYGFSPSSIVGKTIHQINLSASLKSYEIIFSTSKKISLLTKLAVLYNPDPELFIRLPKRYPSGYYSPSALRYLLEFELKQKIGREISWSISYGFLDNEIQALVFDKNSQTAKLIGAYGFSLYYQIISN